MSKPTKCECCTDEIPAGGEHENDLGTVCAYCSQPNHRRCSPTATTVHGTPGGDE